MSLSRVARVPSKVSTSVAAICAALWLTCPVTPAHGTTSLRGQTLTCRDFVDLDFALDHPSSRYFEGWTHTDFDRAQKWASSCAAAPPTSADQDRQSLLAQRRQTLEAYGELRRNDQRAKEQHEQDLRDQHEQEAHDAAENAAAEQQQAQFAASRARYEECLRSRAYQRFQAERRVIEALNRQTAAQSRLDREKRLEQVSGTTDLDAKRYSGEALVNAQDELQRWWTVYEQNGGGARNPKDLSLSSRDPCNSVP